MGKRTTYILAEMIKDEALSTQMEEDDIAGVNEVDIESLNRHSTPSKAYSFTREKVDDQEKRRSIPRSSSMSAVGKNLHALIISSWP